MYVGVAGEGRAGRGVILAAHETPARAPAFLDDSSLHAPSTPSPLAVNGELAAEVRLNATAHFFDLIYVVEAIESHSPTGPSKTQLFSSTP